MKSAYILAVAIGGATGAMSRYLISTAIARWMPVAFPWGTLAVNVVGCYLLGAVHEASPLFGLGPAARALVAVGFIGALTTFSTFTLETLDLMKEGEIFLVFANLALSLLLGFLACLAGIFTARFVVPVV